MKGDFLTHRTQQGDRCMCGWKLDSYAARVYLEVLPGSNPSWIPDFFCGQPFVSLQNVNHMSSWAYTEH